MPKRSYVMRLPNSASLLRDRFSERSNKPSRAELQQRIPPDAGGTLEFFPLADLRPLDDHFSTAHPRLRVVDNTLYMVGTVIIDDVAWPMASTMNLAAPNPTWSPPLRVGAPMVSQPAVDLTGGKVLRTANQFSFDVASVESGSPEFQPDADEFSPQLRVSGTPPLWRAIWLVRPLDAGQIAVDRGNLGTIAGVDLIATSELVPLQTPCSYLAPGGDYWGDYNDLIPLRPTPNPAVPSETPHFLTPFTQNFDGCGFAGDWTAEMHVGAVVFDG